MPRATIKDIAQLIAVSPSTVSRALEDHPDISESTKQKVREAAQSLNYTKNLSARHFRKKQSGLIALIVPEMNMFFIPELINGVNAAAEKNQYSVIILQSDNSIQKEKELLRYCLGLSVDGILICMSEESENTGHIEYIVDKQIPVIMTDKILDSASISSISIDDEDTARIAGDYLISMGHKKVLGIFGHPTLSITKRRKTGFLSAFNKSTTESAENLSIHIPNVLEFDSLTDPIFSNPDTFSAVFCMSDELLIHTYHSMMKNQIRIPEQCSLFAISDGMIPYNLHPNVHHLHHSGYDMGFKAMQLLSGMLSSGMAEQKNIVLETKLCEMQSVKMVS